jgi:Carboxypeptidase regulatory-like domain/TonB-dependent Receptor Plug Domain
MRAVRTKKEAYMKIHQQRFTLPIAVALCLVFASTWLHAQNSTSCAITGTVTDSTGAVLPGVQVTILNQATGLSHTETTNGSGSYDAESLAPGDYTVSTAKGGFKTESIKDIHLDPGQRRGLDIKLSVGSESVAVSVEADAEVVQTESAESGGTITAKEVQNIMLNGRNFESLLTVIPGVSSVNGANGTYQAGQGAITSAVVVNGSSDEETMYTIDGVYNDVSASDITLPITPVVDHIQEMRVLGDNYSARYGLAGRQVLVTTKSGGEQYHGSGYFFDRTNEYGTAHGFLQNGSVPLTSLHQSDWGITLGGPVAIPKLFDNLDKKLFFFVGADWKAVHQSYTSGARDVFSQANRNGDLSTEVVNPAGASANLTPYASLDAPHQAILDARFGGGAGSGAGCLSQKSGSGPYNVILPKCMDANTVALMNAFWPLPNYNTTLAATSQNYLNDNPTKFSVNDELYRGDYNLNSNNLITFRVLHEEVASINATRGYNDYAPNPNSAAYTPSTDALLRWQSTIRPNIINAAGIAVIYSRYIAALIGQYQLPSGVDINQKFPGADPLNRIPDISMNNDSQMSNSWFWLGEGALPTHSNSSSLEFLDDFTVIKGNHALQAGVTLMWDRLHVNASSFPMGNFCFDGSYSNDTAGDYLLGFLANGSHACSSYGYEQTNLQRDGLFKNVWTEAYFEDDWKFNPRLTFNLGMRWSYYTAPTMDGNDVSNFVPSAFSSSSEPAICASPTGAALGTLPACAVSSYGFTSNTWQYLNGTNQPLEKDGVTAANIANNGMLTAGNGVPDGFTTPHPYLFAPRLGFAYRLTNAGKMSIHGGVGFGYTQVGLLQTSNLLSNIPFVQTPVYFNTEFSNPAGASGSGSVPNPPGLLAVNSTNSSYRPATIRNYSLTIEKEVAPGGVVSVGYAGMSTQHIFTTGWDSNFPLNANPVTGTYANPSGTAACVAASTAPNQLTSGFAYDPCLNQGKVNSYYYRPYQGYSSIGTGASFGVANYNGLLVGYVQKMRNLTAHVSYTWSKALGDINATGVQVAYSSSGAFQNSNNPLGDYGRPDYDRPNVFVYSLVYDVPFFNNTSNALEKSLLGGWNLTSYGVDESGFAQTPTYSSGLATRPNISGPLYRNHATSGKVSEHQLPVYSATSFVAPSWGYFGTASVGSLRAPKEVAIHMAVEKGFAIGEWATIKLGAQAFNLLNHPNVLSLNGTWAPGSTTFATATAFGDPRQMQFYTKITF